MIPTLVADEIRETLLDYLRTTWALADHRLEQEFFRFLETGQGHPGSALLQGPYINVKLPFATAPADVECPLEVKPPYQPHLHQLQAWQRLSSRDGHEPEATLVTTGTGSGKTECFLYPILDHCLRAHQLGQGGIKAIVLYPMNALASDQAWRIAEIVHGDPRLFGRLRVGLYVGGDGRNREMGKDHVIDHHDVLQRQPTDILLTNYRMLDLLLVRPKDRGLWLHNKPGALRYLVLDEPHTYDGAQGTDVACLIRRLGARVGSMENLCAVGTSATVSGDDASGHLELVKFASRVFDQELSVESVIDEKRLTAEQLGEVIGGAPEREQYPQVGDELLPEPQEDAEAHVRRVALLWFPRLVDVVSADAFRLALGQAVLSHPLGRALIARASQRVVARSQLELQLAGDLPELQKCDDDARRKLVTSMLTLLSWAQR